MHSAESLVDKFYEKMKGSATEIPHFYAVSGYIITNLSTDLFYENEVIYLNKKEILKKNLAVKLARAVDTFYAKTQYRVNAMKDETWQRLYHQAKRNVAVMSATGHILINAESTYPCHQCGIILPEQFIQVDHYMPQDSGEDASIVKILRALGLTELPSSGKGSLLGPGSKWSGLVFPAPAPAAPAPPAPVKSGPVRMIAEAPPAQPPLRSFFYPKGRKRGCTERFQSSIVDAKWRTTDTGAAFLSLLHHVDPGRGILRTLCLNSYLNLVPLCPLCNNKKENQMKVGMINSAGTQMVKKEDKKDKLAKKDDPFDSKRGKPKREPEPPLSKKFCD